MSEDLIANQRGESTRPSILEDEIVIKTDSDRAAASFRLTNLRGLKVQPDKLEWWCRLEHRLSEAIKAYDAEKTPKPFPVSSGKETDRNMARSAMVDELRIMEERCARVLDQMTKANMDADGGNDGKVFDPRAQALARTKLREAFMWAQEAAFPAPRINIIEE